MRVGHTHYYQFCRVAGAIVAITLRHNAVEDKFGYDIKIMTDTKERDYSICKYLVTSSAAKV